jgi:hypothetical protein
MVAAVVQQVNKSMPVSLFYGSFPTAASMHAGEAEEGMGIHLFNPGHSPATLKATATAPAAPLDQFRSLPLGLNSSAARSRHF